MFFAHRRETVLSIEAGGMKPDGDEPTQDESEKSIQKAADSIRFFCSSAGIHVTNVVLGFNALNEKDVETNNKTIEECRRLGEEVIDCLMKNN